jgi:hypothetical protein
VKTNTNTNQIEPEWIKVSEAKNFSGLGKTYLYSQLDINGGKIRTSLLRRRNARQGTRLINLDSLRAFIENGVGKKVEALEIELEGGAQ